MTTMTPEERQDWSSCIAALIDQALMQTNLPGLQVERGKVRDNYRLPNGNRLIVTTDRFSAFDRILGGFPFKGELVSKTAAWWFQALRDIIPNHYRRLPDPNVMEVDDIDIIPIEAVFRGYLTGITSTSIGYKYFVLGLRKFYDLELPDGMFRNQILSEPAFTPTSKEVAGHDKPLTMQEILDSGIISKELLYAIRDKGMELFTTGQRIASDNDLILVDTKYEFGIRKLKGGKSIAKPTVADLVLGDEAHTPDSSRLWNKHTYQELFAAGKDQQMLDKEYWRIWYDSQHYRGDGEPPVMPKEILIQGVLNYIEQYQRITGQKFTPAPHPAEARIIHNLRTRKLIA